MKELDKILEADERVFWEGGPKFWPYFLTGITRTSLFGLVWMAFLTPFIIVSSSETKGLDIFLTPFLLVGLWVLIGIPIYKVLLYKRLHYAITEKRVIIQKGVIGRDFEYIDFDQVTNAEVTVGFWDKVLKQNTGSIIISSAGSFTYPRQEHPVSRPYTISNIDNPYDVFKFFKQVSYDIKTDIQYPNKLRPEENPGYQTKYDPNKR